MPTTIRSLTFKPASVGEYQFLMKVRDAKGKIAQKTLALKVVPALVNSSYVSSTSISVNESVELHAKAGGGTGNYTYSYSLKSGSSQTWKILYSYSESPVIRCPVSFSGKVTFLIKVKDSAGNVASKTFVVTVSDKALDAKADAVLAQIVMPGMTEFDKARAIHDWLVRNVAYDKAGVQSGNVPSTSFTAEGLFDTRVAVCDGYSKAFLILCERAGLDAVRVTGTATNTSGVTSSHAWNQVKIDGKWYEITSSGEDLYNRGRTIVSINGSPGGVIKTITALYEQNIRENFPIVGTNGVTYTGASWKPDGSAIFNNEWSTDS